MNVDQSEIEPTGLPGGLLEMRDTIRHQRTQWRLVVPDVPELKKQIMRELHEIPYSGHLGYHKTLKNIQTDFLLA